MILAGRQTVKMAQNFFEPMCNECIHFQMFNVSITKVGSRFVGRHCKQHHEKQWLSSGANRGRNNHFVARERLGERCQKNFRLGYIVMLLSKN